MVTFYRWFQEHAGLVYDGTDHTMFGHPLDGSQDVNYDPISGGIDWVRQIVVAPDDAEKLYAWALDPAGSNYFAYLSEDAGATWTKKGQFPGRNGQPAFANSTGCAATDQVWVCNASDNSLVSRKDGVWYSSDDAATWSKILACEGVLSVNGFSAGGGANNSTVSETLTGASSTTYLIMSSPIATDLEFRWTCSTDAAGFTVILEDLSSAVIASEALGSGTSGTYHRTDIATQYGAGARRIRFSGTGTIAGPMSTYKNLTTATGPRGCRTLAMGEDKVWFCWEVATEQSTSPYPFPPQGTALYRIEQCDPDGTDRATIGEITFYASSAYNTSHGLTDLPIRPWGDDFALVISPTGLRSIPPATGTGGLWKVDSTSGAVRLTSGGIDSFGMPVATIPLSDSVWLLAVWDSFGSGNVIIYRTTNSGSSWTSVKTLSGPERSGHNGSTSDVVGRQFAHFPSTDEVLYVGGQGTRGPSGTGTTQTAPLVTWYSDDLGATWSSIVFSDEPDYVDGWWMPDGELGILAAVAGAAPVAMARGWAAVIG